jgi:hypothetical protein
MGKGGLIDWAGNVKILQGPLINPFSGKVKLYV